MSIKITPQRLYAKNSEGVRVPIGIAASGSDASLAEIKSYAEGQLTSVKNEIDAKVAAAKQDTPADISAMNTNFGNLKDNIIKVSDTQPTNEYNKIWVSASEEHVTVPTMEEFETVRADLSKLSENGNAESDDDDGKSVMVTDDAGNVVCEVDENGVSAVDFVACGLSVADTFRGKYEDKFYITDPEGNVIVSVTKDGVKGVGIDNKMASPYAGLKMISIGDSLSAHDKWQKWLCEWTGMQFDVEENTNGKDGHNPMAKGGTQIRPTTSDSILLRAQDAKYYNPDVIFLYAGQNDGVGTLGTINDTPYSDRTCQTDSVNFYANYMGLVEMLLNDCPDAHIFLVNWMQMWESESDTAPTHLRVNRKAKSDAVLEIGKKYRLPVVNQWYESGVNDINAVSFYPEAGNVHPNEKGYKQTAYTVYRTMI